MSDPLAPEVSTVASIDHPMIDMAPDRDEEASSPNEVKMDQPQTTELAPSHSPTDAQPMDTDATTEPSKLDILQPTPIDPQPSVRYLVLNDKLRVHLYGGQLIQEAGLMLQMDQPIISAAQIIYNSFYDRQERNLKDWIPWHVALAATYVACKVLECPRRHRDVLTVFDRVDKKRKNPNPNPMVLDSFTPRYSTWKKILYNFELRIMADRGYDVSEIGSSHKYLLQFLKDLYAPKPLVLKCWELLNDLHRIPLSLKFSRSIQVCSVIFLGARLAQIRLPEDPCWTELFDVRKEDLVPCAAMILELYEVDKSYFFELPTANQNPNLDREPDSVRSKAVDYQRSDKLKASQRRSPPVSSQKSGNVTNGATNKSTVVAGQSSTAQQLTSNQSSPRQASSPNLNPNHVQMDKVSEAIAVIHRNSVMSSKPINSNTTTPVPISAPSSSTRVNEQSASVALESSQDSDISVPSRGIPSPSASDIKKKDKRSRERERERDRDRDRDRDRNRGGKAKDRSRERSTRDRTRSDKDRRDRGDRDRDRERARDRDKRSGKHASRSTSRHHSRDKRRDKRSRHDPSRHKDRTRDRDRDRKKSSKSSPNVGSDVNTVGSVVTTASNSDNTTIANASANSDSSKNVKKLSSTTSSSNRGKEKERNPDKERERRREEKREATATRHDKKKDKSPKKIATEEMWSERGDRNRDGDKESSNRSGTREKREKSHKHSSNSNNGTTSSSKPANKSGHKNRDAREASARAKALAAYRANSTDEVERGSPPYEI